jgi:hypothetical protein
MNKIKFCKNSKLDISYVNNMIYVHTIILFKKASDYCYILDLYVIFFIVLVDNSL